MPVVFRHDGVRYYFFSNEGSPREPAHVHAERDGAEAKFWLRPDVKVVESIGFGRQELVSLIRVVEEQRDKIEEAWNEHFG